MVSNAQGFPLDEVRDVLFRTDVSGRWTYLNRAWTEITGYAVEDSLGRPFLDSIHPDDRERILGLFRPLLERQKDHCFSETRYLTRDGGFRWMEMNSRLALAPDGTATGTIGTLRDITARRDAEADRTFLATLVNRMQEAVIVTDLQWHVQRWTGNAEGIYGWTAAEAIGRPIFGLLCPEAERASMEEVAQKMRGGVARVVGERTRKDGRRIVTDASLGLLLDEGGRPCGVLGVSRDVSAQKLAEQRESEERCPRDGSAFPIEVSTRRVQVGDEALLHCPVCDLTEQRAAERALKESEARFRTLLDGAPVGVFETDAQGRCTFVNRVWQQMTGLTFEQAKDSGWLNALYPESREAAAALWAATTGAGETISRACRLLGPDGKPASVQLWAAPQRDALGHLVGYVGVLVDLTDRQRVEETLRQSNHRKTEFFAVLSHELRNPLAPMRNAAFLLDRAPPGSAQAERAKGVLQRQTAHLAQLVDDLLDVNRIARGTIALARVPVDARAMLRATCEDYGPIFERRGVELRLSTPGEPIWIDADATRIRQVIGNLLHNAAKFAPSGGYAAASLTASLDRARIIVTDSGPGVDAKLLGKLFEPLGPPRQSSAKAGAGLGLGLALVKGLVEAHGGDVSVQTDAQGWGRGFEVSLPLGAPPAGPPRAAPDTATAPPAKRVLIIEDDPDAGQTLAEVLGTDGHSVHVAIDGRTGIALAHELEPNVVVCDIGLPDIDGFEVARSLRADPRLAGTRLIAFSGHAMAEDLERSRSAGFDAHLRKPASVEHLLRVVGGQESLGSHSSFEAPTSSPCPTPRCEPSN